MIILDYYNTLNPHDASKHHFYISEELNCLMITISFLSPGRWGSLSEISVAPGVRPASTLIMGASYHFFYDFKITFLATSLHGHVQVIFKDATKIENGHQRSTPKFFVGRKN